MRKELSFSPEADDAWAAIIARDAVQARAIDAVLDQLETDASQVRAVPYDVHAYVTAVYVPGRDDASWIIWKHVGDAIRVEHIGRSHL